jgi:hypothetical protein
MWSPEGGAIQCEEGAEFGKLLDEVKAGPTEGALVEPKKASATIPYRAQSDTQRLPTSKSPGAGRRRVKKGASKPRPENPLLGWPPLPPRSGIRKRGNCGTQ